MGIISANIMLSAVCESSFCCCCSCKVFRFVSYENVAPYVDVEAVHYVLTQMLYHMCWSHRRSAGVQISVLFSISAHTFITVCLNSVYWTDLLFTVFICLFAGRSAVFIRCCLDYTICIEKIRDVGFVNLKWLIKYSLNIKTFK